MKPGCCGRDIFHICKKFSYDGKVFPTGGDEDDDDAGLSPDDDGVVTEVTIVTRGESHDFIFPPSPFVTCVIDSLNYSKNPLIGV